MSTKQRVLIVFFLALFPLLWVGTDFLLEQYKLLAKPGSSGPTHRWYKGNTHTHTLWSDGNDFPESVVRFYKEGGWHFLVLTDHNVLSRGEKWMSVADIDKRRQTLGHPTLEKYRMLFGDDWVETRKGEDGAEEVRIKPLSEFRGQFEAEEKFLLIEGEEVTDRYKGANKSHEVHMNAINLGEKIAPQGGDSVSDVIAKNLRAIREQELRLKRPILEHLNHPELWVVDRPE